MLETNRAYFFTGSKLLPVSLIRNFKYSYIKRELDTWLQYAKVSSWIRPKFLHLSDAK